MEQKSGCLRGYVRMVGGVLLKGRFVRTLNVVGRLLGHGRPSTGNRYVQLDDAT